MTLYDYLEKSGNWENTVWDKDYEIETYFYKKEENKDKWDLAMIKLSKLIEVDQYNNGGVTVLLSKLIEDNIENIKKADLFYCEITVDNIMDSIESILSGNVSETWMEEFVDVLSKGGENQWIF